jgi:hypothetical protein
MESEEDVHRPEIDSADDERDYESADEDVKDEGELLS